MRNMVLAKLISIREPNLMKSTLSPSRNEKQWGSGKTYLHLYISMFDNRSETERRWENQTKVMVSAMLPDYQWEGQRKERWWSFRGIQRSLRIWSREKRSEGRDARDEVDGGPWVFSGLRQAAGGSSTQCSTYDSGTKHSPRRWWLRDLGSTKGVASRVWCIPDDGNGGVDLGFRWKLQLWRGTRKVKMSFNEREWWI